MMPGNYRTFLHQIIIEKILVIEDGQASISERKVLFINITWYPAGHPAQPDTVFPAMHIRYPAGYRILKNVITMQSCVQVCPVIINFTEADSMDDYRTEAVAVRLSTHKTVKS